MGYRNQAERLRDLESNGHLIRLEDEIDADLEAAEIQRRVYASGGPAVLFTNVKNCPFPMVSNLFGTRQRAQFLFRDTWERVRRLIELKIDPTQLLRSPFRYAGSPWTALRMLPRRVRSSPVLAGTTSIHDLPGLRSWPRDGGPFVTLPQVYSEDPRRPGLMASNLGMYRVQLSGNSYRTDAEVGLHYQIHRSIGVHHAAAKQSGVPFRVNVFVGGTPAMTLAAVMPLPEGMTELTFAGALAGHRIPMARIRTRRGGDDAGQDYLPVYAQADFCIVGDIDPDRTLPEGPFGDHLGYYSMQHQFPVLRVRRVYHRRDAVWPFTVVGRPPQEDTTFGELIHDLTGPIIPTVIPGVAAVHAVDAAGVHPLLLALGSERYTPYQDLGQPQELLTQASAILGQGQLSLAKYLWIAAREDDDELDPHKIEHFLRHVLLRADWRRDLHFHTRTTMDTLDYTGRGLNQGSKLVIAAAGPPRRELPTELPQDLRLPDRFSDPRVCLPGILAIRAPKFTQPVAQHAGQPEPAVSRFVADFGREAAINRFPLVILVDDSEFAARSLNNLLWVTFTRSDPAADVHGIESFFECKHWGCHGSLVIDARIKPHHAEPLVEDPQVSKKIDALASRKGPLAAYL